MLQLRIRKQTSSKCSWRHRKEKFHRHFELTDPTNTRHRGLTATAETENDWCLRSVKTTGSKSQQRSANEVCQSVSVIHNSRADFAFNVPRLQTHKQQHHHITLQSKNNSTSLNKHTRQYQRGQHYKYVKTAVVR